MESVKFKGANSVVGKESDEVPNLYLHIDKTDIIGAVTACYELTEEEIQTIRMTKRIWLQQYTFGKPLQFMGLSTEVPVEIKIQEN